MRAIFSPLAKRVSQLMMLCNSVQFTQPRQGSKPLPTDGRQSLKKYKADCRSSTPSVITVICGFICLSPSRF